MCVPRNLEFILYYSVLQKLGLYSVRIMSILKKILTAREVFFFYSEEQELQTNRRMGRVLLTLNLHIRSDSVKHTSVVSGAMELEGRKV
jgi:hypothetical protein